MAAKDLEPIYIEHSIFLFCSFVLCLLQRLHVNQTGFGGLDVAIWQILQHQNIMTTWDLLSFFFFFFLDYEKNNDVT